MQRLNFKEYFFRLKKINDKLFIFDEIRKKFVALQPEEWVRQHVIRFLIEEKKVPKSLINVEKEITINGLAKRYDIVVFSRNGNILLAVECKAPTIQISQVVFDQIARYNLMLKSEILMITNGLNHYFCQMDYQNGKYLFLKELPEYDFLTKMKEDKD
ncbi:type I restriction enzyme HsdR N-terminal domain-containing protein [Capnocytophaga cynodegmi]|uniref:Type I restriction enzyme R protein N-terminal domain protein n=1 Tax=Capnocytophaga cynodegmi TaxID=28189 RepID=A0A0B7H869_9FLAO|nr:type I restriction enzyme HsdR N-terminal domain-containing protein [Capnocytophaga cynodegmi]CEN35565.1 Type I restriction enzyme R protein N-terminal domain protein [Capnocytophaga cynodegmi]